MRASLRLRSMPLLVLAVLVLVCAKDARADGGRLLFRQNAGPFVVTLFASPDPLTAGRADFSVAVEKASSAELVEDAQIELVLTPADGGGKMLILHPSHAEATSKWLQAVNFSLPQSGRWRITVMVRRGKQTGACSGGVQVGRGGSRNLLRDVWPVPLVALLFVLHVRRKGKYSRDCRRGTPHYVLN